MSPAPLRLSASSDLKQRRLAELLAGRSEADSLLRTAVSGAQALGSLQLAGLAFEWEEVMSASRGEPAPEPLSRQLRAVRAVDPDAPLDRRAFLGWHAALTGGAGAFRRGERRRAEGPPPAPAAFIESRLALLADWLATASGRALAAPRRGALALARTLEVLPFDEANGRVARLAASHVIVGAGGRPPILVAGDGERLAACVQAAFRFEMEPLSLLLQEASERAVDVMLQTLQAGAGDGVQRP